MDNNIWTFTITNDDGKEVTYEVLFAFEDEFTHQDYIVYTDHTRDKDGKLNILSSRYNPDDSHFEIFPIESEEEKALVNYVCMQFQDILDSDELEAF